MRVTAHLPAAIGASLAARDVGELVRERRASIGLTQRDLACASGVSIGALRDLEQGRTRCPRWSAVAAIAAALGLEMEEAQPPADGPGLRIGVLGPLTAVRSGTAIGLGSLRQRAVLGLLALHGTAGVPRDVIIDVLWGERPPRSATAEVQAYVSRLRQLLDPGRTLPGRGGPVPLTGRHYRLAEGTGLDAGEFGRLSRRADAACGAGDFRLACLLYERALNLWRGEVAADVELLQGYPAAAPVARRRDEAVLRFARVAGAAGAYERLLPHVRDMCVREPFNEQAHACLMTGLAATGQQAAAVMLFGELRHRLDRELGIRPGAQLAAAHVRILRR
jgi:DNA-binding SARP family transcriptional activator